MTQWQSGKIESSECMQRVVLWAVVTSSQTRVRLQTVHLLCHRLHQLLISCRLRHKSAIHIAGKLQVCSLLCSIVFITVTQKFRHNVAIKKLSGFDNAVCFDLLRKEMKVNSQFNQFFGSRANYGMCSCGYIAVCSRAIYIHQTLQSLQQFF